MEFIRKDNIIYISDGKSNRCVHKIGDFLNRLKAGKLSDEEMKELPSLMTLSALDLQAQMLPTPDEGKYNILTNTFVLMNMSPGEFCHTALAVSGVEGCIRIFAPTEELEMHMDSHIINARRVVSFLQEEHPALRSYFWNTLSGREMHKLSALKGFLKGKPILYCGAGPSLTENFDKIEQIIKEDRAFVVTGGTGIKIFHDRGISPHLCLALDPHDVEFQRFQDLSESWQKSTVLLADRILNPKCFSSWKGTLLTTEGIPMCGLGTVIEGKECELIDQGGTGVTTWMAHLADYFKAESMYMIGVDMCFSEEGGAYADDQDFIDAKRKCVEFAGKKTRRLWVEQAMHLQNIFAQYNSLVYQLNPDALPIEGVNFTDFSKLLEKNSESFEYDLIPYSLEERGIFKENSLLFRDMLRGFHNNFVNEEFLQSIPYKFLLKDYDIVAEHEQLRSGIYNYSRIRGVMRYVADLIDEVLSDAEYGDVYHQKVSHHGTLRSMAVEGTEILDSQRFNKENAEELDECSSLKKREKDFIG